MKITYIDSGVLLSATDGVGRIAEKTLEILGDSQREFASSEFVKLEVTPKAIYNKQTEEAQFYEEFFSDVRDFQIKKYTTFLVGWTSCPPLSPGGRDAHPTRVDNLFLGSPLPIGRTIWLISFKRLTKLLLSMV
ncbi:hypothetical protein NIES25_11750 [Nostoc linckia NIES-25]|nr:hypothetical protein NIES25_11750 [Nostoc linckia NIES-25]